MAKKSISRTPKVVERLAGKAARASNLRTPKPTKTAPPFRAVEDEGALMKPKAVSIAQPLFTSFNRVAYKIAARSDSEAVRNDADFFFGCALKLLKDFAYEIGDDRADGIVALFEMSDGARNAANEFARNAKLAGGAA